MPIVSVAAPAGYGKTTLLAQWAAEGRQSFTWVSLDESDNDPKVLLACIAEALDEVEPIGGRVFDAARSSVSSVPGSVLPRVVSAFASMTSPVVLVLDDVHILRNRQSRAAVSLLAEHVPQGSRLVVAGRAEPPLRLPRLRAGGRVTEIRPLELSLSPDDAAALLRYAGLMLSEADVYELHQRTEGWAAGLYLAALCLREGGSLATAATSFGGDDRLVSEYLESEFLSRITPTERTFLTQASVLQSMCGPLCDATLGISGSAQSLAALAASNLLLVPLDRRGYWYRYHHLFRDMLLADLERNEPRSVPTLRLRASEWCAANGLPNEAVEYALAAEDVAAGAALVEQHWRAYELQHGSLAANRWFRWLDKRDGIEGHPMLAAGAALNFVTAGPPADADRWAALLDRSQADGTAAADGPALKASAALLRAMRCRSGVERMRADANEAVTGFAASNFVMPAAVVMQGLARLMGGDEDGAQAAFDDAATVAEDVSAHEMRALAICQQSLIAISQRDWARAGELAAVARAILSDAGIEESYTSALVCAVLAQTALHRGDITAADRELVSAQRTRSALTFSLPHLAVQARLALARVHLAVSDLPGARTLMREIDELLRRRPNLGNLSREADALRGQLSKEQSTSAPGASTLTAAELRMLPLLTTHLSFVEIAAELVVSIHTVKSHALSIYRKLGASTRSQAVERARELMIIDAIDPPFSRSVR
ncbi:LuxR C-terminal-related transcriptional regulator [Jatrophihabitans sp. DSM 45814]